MANIKELSKQPERFSGGHRLCAGCGASIIVHQVLMATKDPVVASASTGCLEVASTIYPYTAWKIPFIHNAFENVAATISGVETAYRALKKKGKITKEIKFVAFGGDGGTYDIGLQALSGTLERGHKIVYVCYNNEAYMNCLSTSSMIITETGLKKITEVKQGDRVYAFDQKTNKIACRTKSKIFTWKLLEHIKIGDEIVALKNLETGFESEEVINIKLAGKEPTLDLSVEGEHNFIADGIV